VAVGLSPLAAVGDNCIDRYVPPERPDTVGGNALNVAVGLARAGHPTVYLGAVGDDSEGRFVLELAAAAGVDVSHVRILEAPTGITTVELRPGGERSFLDEAYGASEFFRLDDDGLELLDGCAWVHAAHLTGAAETIRRLGERGHRLSYDFSDHGDLELRAALCRHLHVAFFSAPDEDASAAAELAAAALAEGAQIAVITRGARGSLAAVPGERFEQKAKAVTPVDTLGAGDAFIAAMIAALVAGASIPESLRRAAEAAAKTCEVIGPWPVAKEVRA
jgi:fructoselysine 6-kinase